MNGVKSCLAVLVVVTILCSPTQVFATLDQTRLGADYSKWLKEDVRWIITDNEREELFGLKNDNARDEFVKEFWERRNPTPGSTHNPFKEEHYRRLAFANEHFAAGIPGWKSDRGHIYIVRGSPDKITSHPASGTTGPSQIWLYHLIGKSDLVFEFVDVCRCGEYQLKR